MYERMVSISSSRSRHKSKKNPKNKPKLLNCSFNDTALTNTVIGPAVVSGVDNRVKVADEACGGACTAESVHCDAMTD